MKVVAIVSAGLVAGAGLLVLWQASRAPADAPRARRVAPTAAPGPARDSTAPRSGEPTAQPAAEGRSEPDAAVARRPREDAPVPEAATTGERRLLGAVLGEDGPLPGAQLLILERGEPVAEADTDAQGRFEIGFPVPIDHAALRILARGYAPLERSLGSPRQPGQEYLGNLKVLRGSVLSGSVVDSAGRPVAGVDVGMALWSGDYTGIRILERTRTDTAGSFRFPNAPRGRITLTAHAEGWADCTSEHTHGTGEDARIQLVRASTLRLRVRTPDGLPVVGAAVQIQPTERRSTPREGETDAEGRTVFENLDAPTWSVRVMETGYRPFGLPAVPADGFEQTLELVPWPCIEGVVLTSNRKPAAEARVLALPGGARGDTVQVEAGGTPVDEEGRFRVCNLRPGSYVIRASAPAFAPTTSHVVEVGESGDLDIGAIVLLDGGTLALELVSARKPVAGAIVELHRTQPVPAQLWVQSAVPAGTPVLTTDAAGRVSIGHLEAGEVWLILRGENTVPRTAGPYSLIEGRRTEPDALELEGGTRVEGTVLDAEGAALPRARILATGPSSIPAIFADEAGHFALPPLPHGTYDLRVQVRVGAEMRESAPEVLELAPGQSVAKVELRLDPR